MIADRIWPTLQIGALTIVISVLIAVPMGVVAAWRHRSAIDYAVMTFSVLGFSVPVFVIGYVFIQIFSIEMRWLPVRSEERRVGKECVCTCISRGGLYN